MKKEMGLIAVGALVAIVLLGASTALVLRDDGIQFPDGSVQTTAAGPGLRIVDSLGQTIGPVLEFKGEVLTFLYLGATQEPVFFTITREKYIPLHYGNEFWFSGPDCTGDVAIEGLVRDPLSVSGYGFGGPGLLYRVDEFQGSTNIVRASRWDGIREWTSGDFSDQCVNDPRADGMGYPAELFADLTTLPFVPDFRYE